MFKNLILFVFFYIYSCFLFAQTEGVVLSSEGYPLQKVNVFLVDQNILLETDNKGVFYIEKDIPNNTYIEFYKFGYSSKLIKYTNDQKIIIYLNELHVKLDDIGVSESFSYLGNSKNINIEKKDLSNSFLSSNSILENVTQIGGLNLIGSGLGIQKIVVRGLSGMRVVTYLNGMKIENQQWANDHGIGFTSLGLKNMEFIKGSSGLKYGGEALGGVLYFQDEPFIVSKHPSFFIASKFDNSHLLFGNQFGFKWSRKQFFITLYGENNFASDYRLPNKRFLFNSRFRDKSFKISIANRGVKMHNVLRYQYNAAQVGLPAHAHGNLENVILEDITSGSRDLMNDFKLTRPTQFIDNHLFIFENNYFLNKTKYSVYLGHFINNLKEYEKWTFPAFDMTLSTTTFRADLRTTLNSFIFNVGGQFSHLKNNNNILEYLIPNASSNDIGFYSTLDYEIGNKGLNVGFRLDIKNISSPDENYHNSFSSISSSSGLYFKNKNHILRLTYAGAFRSPHFSELFSDGVHHGTNRYEIGNNELKLEKGYQFDVKYQWSNEHIGLVFNPFLQYIYDYISINPSNEFHQNIYRIYNYTQFNKVKLSGCEMNFHYHPHFMHDLHFEQSYSFLRTKNYDNNNVLALIPSDKIKTRITFNLDKKDLPFNLSTLSLYNVYSFKQDNIIEYEIPTQSYNLINVELFFKPFKNIDMVLGVANLFNTEYTPHLSRMKEVGGGVPNQGRSYNINFKYEF